MKIISVGIIPIRKVNNQYFVLLVHEVGGYWGFPKGHLNPGETDTMAALREFYEETGIDTCDIADDFKHIRKYSFKKNDVIIDKEVTFFLGLVNEDKEILNNCQVRASKWFLFEEALKQLTYEESGDILKEALNYLQKKVPLNFKRHQFDHEELPN